ncbi:hypothetical protein ASE74_01140 [Pedobacter sp. Leaf216]|nr:hypothetical protein ASE74_01140 [Pedobacter sp. Leaf216]
MVKYSGAVCVGMAEKNNPEMNQKWCTLPRNILLPQTKTGVLWLGMTGALCLGMGGVVWVGISNP